MFRSTFTKHVRNSVNLKTLIPKNYRYSIAKLSSISPVPTVTTPQLCEKIKCLSADTKIIFDEIDTNYKQLYEDIGKHKFVVSPITKLFYILKPQIQFINNSFIRLLNLTNDDDSFKLFESYKTIGSNPILISFVNLCYLYANKEKLDMTIVYKCYISMLQELIDNDNDDIAMVILGNYYLTGLKSIVQQNNKIAFDLFIKAAGMGNYEAMKCVQHCYQNDLVPGKNSKESQKYNYLVTMISSLNESSLF